MLRSSIFCAVCLSAFSGLLSACKCQCGATARQGGETRTQAKYERLWERDTVLVTLPEFHAEQTADTISVIESNGITTTARVTPQGITHTLDVEVSAPVEVLTLRETRDSVAVVTEVVEVEKELTRWQRAQIWAGRIALLALALALAARALRKKDS